MRPWFAFPSFAVSADDPTKDFWLVHRSDAFAVVARGEYERVAERDLEEALFVAYLPEPEVEDFLVHLSSRDSLADPSEEMLGTRLRLEHLRRRDRPAVPRVARVAADPALGRQPVPLAAHGPPARGGANRAERREVAPRLARHRPAAGGQRQAARRPYRRVRVAAELARSSPEAAAGCWFPVRLCGSRRLDRS